MPKIIRTVVLAALACASISVCLSENASSKYAFPPGSPQYCLTEKGERISLFEVLTGGGWDNLRNRDMAMIMEVNYSLCRTTDDGQLLIPDYMYTIPIKTSNVDTYAELFEHWQNYTSTTSSSINVEAGGAYKGFGISGKFSKGYEEVKSNQYSDKTVTIRTQVRYARYTAKLEPHAKLTHEFRRRLRKIGANIRLNRTDTVSYESQLLVRHFGTHIITSIDAGASLSQIDSLYSSFYRDHSSEKHSIIASASANFLEQFKFGIDYSQSTSKSMTEQYLQNRASSKVETFGGPLYRPGNYTASEWSSSVANNMVAIDRSGDPIYFVITENNLPELPRSTVLRVRESVKNAVDLYYKHNMIHGCTRRDSPNFSFQANVEDGTCKPTTSNYPFGGVYQTCHGTGTGFCDDKTQKNPLTGDYTCPAGYQAVKIHEGSKTTEYPWDHCDVLLFIFGSCSSGSYSRTERYTAYWCAATRPIPQNTGFLFGGLYTTEVANRVTDSTSCPAEYYGLTILDDLVVCVSGDYELGTTSSLPFAGFFSCKSGNPLALEENAHLLKSATAKTLKSFMEGSRGLVYPKTCPEGYSQHLAVIDGDCEVNYCVKSGSLTPQGLAKVVLPPFIRMPTDRPEYSNAETLFSDDGELVAPMDNSDAAVSQYLKSRGLPPTTINKKGTGAAGDESGSGSIFSEPVTVAAISIAATLVVVLACVVYIAVRRGRSSSTQMRRE